MATNCGNNARTDSRSLKLVRQNRLYLALKTEEAELLFQKHKASYPEDPENDLAQNDHTNRSEVRRGIFALRKITETEFLLLAQQGALACIDERFLIGHYGEYEPHFQSMGWEAFDLAFMWNEIDYEVCRRSWIPRDEILRNGEIFEALLDSGAGLLIIASCIEYIRKNPEKYLSRFDLSSPKFLLRRSADFGSIFDEVVNDMEQLGKEVRYVPLKQIA